MPEKLKKIIGVVLLIVSVSGVSCGSMINAISAAAPESDTAERIK